MPCSRLPLLLTIVLCGAGAPLSAAAVGSTATGETEVRVEVSGQVRIRRLSDIELGSYGGSGTLRGSSGMCIYRNGTGRYAITMTSQNAENGRFRVASGGEHMAFSVRFEDDSGQIFDDVRSGQRLDRLQGHAKSQGCQGNLNATLEVSFTEEELQSAVQGSYMDVITLVVEPD